MIHVNSKNFNTTTTNIQQYFIDFYQSIPLEELTCPNCGARLIRYGTYSRTLKTNGKSNSIQIQRVCCTNIYCTCRHHALIPSVLLPCCQLLSKDIFVILHAYHTHSTYDSILSTNPLLDLRWIQHIIHRFINYCSIESISILSNNTFLENYFYHYNRGFMISPHYSYCFYAIPT
ncbi:DUF6431 domain-containing protein [Tannockella kyphosi]|uniref:DUF6431 domain-containing protein n=1 Tax=Tannockella kyphosi TaxID=2899121 RepID=UPI002013288D|nr:DUF6431 domain-containing protein [Tannockella kyphosi]